jgi:SMC interacting uncharacterized protein involved in chromosome segregation
MASIKLNLSKLTISGKLDLAKQIINAMTGNSNFTTPNPTLAQLTTAANNLEAARDEVLALRAQAKNKTVIQEQLEDALEKLLTQLASYVENISANDPAIITSAGMDIRAAATPIGPLAPPSRFNTTTGDSDGEIDASWNSDPGAKSYVIETSTQGPPAAVWTQAKTTTKSKETITGLQSGQRYWFHVAAIGATGQSGWSDISTRIAP